MKIAGLKPLGDRVLVKPVHEEEKSKGGILFTGYYFERKTTSWRGIGSRPGR